MVCITHTKIIGITTINILKNPVQNKAKLHDKLVAAISFIYLIFLFPATFLNVKLPHMTT